jgi:glycosyltransferase involved in cell wall biosynthesis
MMKVVHFSMVDFWGYGKSAYRLHKMLQNLGIESTMLVLSKLTGDPSVKMIIPDPRNKKKVTLVEKIIPYKQDSLNPIVYIIKEWEKIFDINPMLKEGEFIFSGTTSFVDLSGVPFIKEADVIHIHWASGIVDFRLFLFSLMDKPICITLYDMNPFTGGCHFSGECNGYRSGCKNCPRLPGYKRYIAEENYDLKHKFYKLLDVHVIATSSWIRDKALESKIFEDKNIEVIFPAVPEDTFFRLNKNRVRNYLLLPQNEKIGMFCVSNLCKTRVDMKKLIDAISIVNKNLNIHLMLVGSYPEKVDLKKGNVIVHLFGFINSEEILNWYYSVADLFVLPLVEGNISISAIEAMCCGLPVVSFDVGGMRDIIDHKETGYLARVGDIEDLAEGIRWILNDNRYRRLSFNCREKVLDRFSLKKNAEKYIEIYKNCIKTKKVKRNELVGWGEDLFRNKKIDDALKVFEKLREIFPEDAEVLNNIGVIWWEKKDFNNAFNFFKKAFKLKPNSKEIDINYKKAAESIK